MEAAVAGLSRLAIGIRIEAVRLCGIRQEPLESWIKDADGRNVPELRLNSLLMAEAFLRLLGTGLGALILVSASAVVLGGFSTKIKKEDFWYITAIGIIQTAKVVGSLSGPTARFFVQFPAASMHRKISTWTRRGHVGDVTEFVGVASMVPILFAAAPIVTGVAYYVLSLIGGLGAVQNYGGSDTDHKRGNMKPALIVFYSLVLAQGVLLILWCGVSMDRSGATLRFGHNYFGIRNKNGKELVDRYITHTEDKCIGKGVFSTTNRTLVLEAIVTTEIADMTERRKFLASFLGLAVQIRENLVTAEAFANAVRGLPVGNNIFSENVFYFERGGQVFCRFIKLAKKLKEIIVEMKNESEDEMKNQSEDETCLVITKAATKLVTWTMGIEPVYAHYFQQEKIVDKLKDIVNAMGDLERCVVLRGDVDADADEMEPYETLQTLVEKVRNLVPPPPLQH